MLTIKHIPVAKGLSLDHDSWNSAEPVNIDRYWSGDIAPPGRHCRSRLLWSDSALRVLFEARRSEPLVICSQPRLDVKTIGLWDRDVFEIFIAPDVLEWGRYFEFEAAPTGEWVDLSIDFTSGNRVTHQGYCSGMRAAAEVDGDQIRVAMEIPWSALGLTPRPGLIFLGNLFRCVGEAPNRGYLAWHPTMTEIPNFHVPDRFGKMILA